LSLTLYTCRPRESRDPYRVISRWNLGGRHLVPAFAGTTPWLVFSVRRVGKGALAPCPPFNASHAMVGTLRFAHPTHCTCIRNLAAQCPGLQSPCPLTTEAQGTVRCTRGLVQNCQKKAHTAYRFSGGNRPSLRSGLRLTSRSPGDRLSCHRHFAGLIPQTWRQHRDAGPHDFAVRESCARLRKRRPPHPTARS
jgi:hypothetical protein